MIPGVVGGTERYASGLLHGLSRINKDFDYLIFLNKESENWPVPNSSHFLKIISPLRATNRINRYLFEQFYFPTVLKQNRIDLIHSLGYVGPVLTNCPHVVTIHDLNTLGIKDYQPLSKRTLLNFFIKLSALKSDHIITVSDFSRLEIAKLKGIPLSKITVSYEGLLEQRTHNFESHWPDLKKQYHLPHSYITAFSSQSPHKNIPNLIKSFSQISSLIPHNLVIIGHLQGDGIINSLINQLGLSKRVITTGYIPDEHAVGVLKNAELFVFPSLYEGFGLPILEAQSLGVCVACSSKASLPEVAEAGAIYFNPNSIDDMASTLLRCLNSPDLRNETIKCGYENVKRFSWEKTAYITSEVYKNVYGKNAGL